MNEIKNDAEQIYLTVLISREHTLYIVEHKQLLSLQASSIDRNNEYAGQHLKEMLFGMGESGNRETLM